MKRKFNFTKRKFKFTMKLYLGLTIQESKQAKNPWLPITYGKQYSIKQKILIYKDIRLKSTFSPLT